MQSRKDIDAFVRTMAVRPEGVTTREILANFPKLSPGNAARRARMVCKFKAKHRGEYTRYFLTAAMASNYQDQDPFFRVSAEPSGAAVITLGKKRMYLRPPQVNKMLRVLTAGRSF